jgi:hypothetical protein
MLSASERQTSKPRALSSPACAFVFTWKNPQSLWIGLPVLGSLPQSIDPFPVLTVPLGAFPAHRWMRAFCFDLISLSDAALWPAIAMWGNLRATAARTRAFSEDEPYRETIESAACACASSGMG